MSGRALTVGTVILKRSRSVHPRPARALTVGRLGRYRAWPQDVKIFNLEIFELENIQIEDVIIQGHGARILKAVM